MCGELDDDIHINAEIRDRLRILSRRVGIETEAESDPGPLAEDAARAAYMERVFRDGLAAVLSDVEGAEPGEKIDVIASRAIALARLAGFLAGQLPPDADLFRGAIEAMTDGYAEPRRIAAELRAQMEDHHHHRHHHDHDDAHHQDHGHGHSHHHHSHG